MDSLDTVEVVMAIEEVSLDTTTSYVRVLTTLQEFSIEIPDKEADAIHSGTLGLGVYTTSGESPSNFCQ